MAYLYVCLEERKSGRYRVRVAIDRQKERGIERKVEVGDRGRGAAVAATAAAEKEICTLYKAIQELNVHEGVKYCRKPS